MKLWIGNIEPGTSDEELLAFVKRYGVEVVGPVQKVEGDGGRPAAVLEVAATQESLLQITQRLNGMYWKGRALNVQAVTR